MIGRVANLAKSLAVSLLAASLLGGVASAQEPDPWGPDDPAPSSAAPDSDTEPSESTRETSAGDSSTDDGSDVAARAARLTDDDLTAQRAKSQRNRELLSVEQDVSGLKERIFRSKATLQLLRELVIEGSTLGSRLSLWHVNKLSGAYSVESIQYFVDGKAVFSRTDTTGGLDGLKDLEIHDQTLPPGAHVLQVSAVLRGSGLGVFSYLRAYSFKVQSSYSFTIEDGKLTVLRVRLDTKGGPFASFVDRPDVAYEEVRESLRSE